VSLAPLIVDDERDLSRIHRFRIGFDREFGDDHVHLLTPVAIPARLVIPIVIPATGG
jgi:hypothetical protein